ncbi:MAG: c-type cytochrome [Anaerolineae bacterium]|nr:c-type cytochrome [Anaerolineae bacterium]
MKSTRYGIIIVCLVSLVLVGCGQSSQDRSDNNPSTENTIATRQALYVTHCAACHGAEGKGQFPDDPYGLDANDLVGAPPHDATGHTWHHPDAALVQIIQNGRSQPGVYPMPAFGDKLTQGEILAILDYLKTWWTPEQVVAQATASAQYTPSVP